METTSLIKDWSRSTQCRRGVGLTLPKVEEGKKRPNGCLQPPKWKLGRRQPEVTRGRMRCNEIQEKFWLAIGRGGNVPHEGGQTHGVVVLGVI